MLNPTNNPKVRVSSPAEDPWQDYVEFRFAFVGPEGLHIAKPLEFTLIPEEERNTTRPTEPALTIYRKTPEGNLFLRSLMDQLWAMGVRPTEQGSPGQLKATEAHLEDMRRLVAKAYDAPLKPASSI